MIILSEGNTYLEFSLLKNPIDQHNELHRSKKNERKSILIFVVVISVVLIPFSVHKNRLLNGNCLITVGRVTKVNPAKIHYDFEFDGKTYYSEYDYSKGKHLPRKKGDLLIIQVSKIKPKYNFVISKYSNINKERQYGQVVKDVPQVKTSWWRIFLF